MIIRVYHVPIRHWAVKKTVPGEGDHAIFPVVRNHFSKTWTVAFWSTVLASPYLVGGWPYPSEKWWTSAVGMMTFPTEWKVIKFHGSSWGYYSHIWKVIKFHGSKPPTRCWYINIAIQTWWFSIVFCMFTRGTVPNHQPDMGRPRICHQRHQLEDQLSGGRSANSTSQRTAVVREKCLLICEVSPRKMRF